MKKVKEWLWRYLPANLSSTTCAVLGASLVYAMTKNQLFAAYAGTIGDNLGYYGVIGIRDLQKNRAKYKESDKKFGFSNFFTIIRNLGLEFGFSELLDTFVVRPFCLFWFPIWMPTYALGIITGKYVADIIFYIPTIVAYELRKKYLKD